MSSSSSSAMLILGRSFCLLVCFKFFGVSVSEPAKDTRLDPCFSLKNVLESSCCGTAETNPTSNHEAAGSIPGFTQWVKGLHCCDQWCRWQMQLGSHVAVALE